MTKPKICELTGTEVGEVFAVRKADGGTYDAEVTKYGYIAFAGTHSLIGGDYVCDIYNGKATIERSPRFSENELGALRLLYDDGMRYVARNSNGRLHVYDNAPDKGAVAWLLGDAYSVEYRLPRFLFPQVQWSDDEPLDIAATLRAARMEVEE